MADYQRILSYLYRYEKAEKKECFGFVKAEQKSGSLKLTIQIDDERLLQGMELKLCFYERQGESWQVWQLDTLITQEHKEEIHLTYPAAMLPAGFRIKGQSGVLLYYQDAFYYGSVWIGEEIPAETLEPLRWHKIVNSAKDKSQMQENKSGKDIAGKISEKQTETEKIIPDKMSEKQKVSTRNITDEMLQEQQESEENILEEKAITKSVNIISDIAWANGFGRTITARSDEMVIPDNMNRYIYPGSILEASSIAETRFTPIPVKNNPVHVSVSFPAKKVGGTIKEPSLLNIRQFVMDLMQQNNIGKQSATLSFDVQKFVSYDELKMTFGSNENTGLLFWGTSSAQYQNKYRIIRSSGLCIKFIQKYFTLDMDIPSNGLISGTIPGGYSPVYVSSIAYGRIGILTLETNYDYEKANKLVKETFNSLFINKNNTLTKEQEAFFNSAEMKVFIAGGSGVTGVKTIGGIKEFTNYITEGGEFSASSPGKPIFCSFANYSDDSPYRINFKIDIDSDPVYARLEYDITKDVSGGNVKSWYTDANVYLRFYADKACSIKTIAQNYIGFNINRLILQQYVGPNYSVSKAREVKLDQNLTFHNQTKGIEYPIAYGHRMTETIGTTYLDRGNWTNDHFYLRAGKFYQVRPPINMKYTCFIDYHNQNEYDCSDFE